MIKREELVSGCMAKAFDDEMTFVLLSRDSAAPATIRFWVLERIKTGKNKWTDAKIVEAMECVHRMEEQGVEISHRRMAQRVDEEALAQVLAR